MKAAYAAGYGSPNVLEIREVDMPTPKENEVLVRVYAASATTADGMIRTGKPYFGRLFTGIKRPKNPIPGTGFAGDVVATGTKVTEFKAGDQVFGETTLGFSTNAEYVTVPETGVILPKPENLSYEEAATFCDGHLTSINFLKEVANIQPGQKILINGASGSLGTAAVQLAKYFGAEVTAVTSARNTGLVKSLGADHVIDYTKEDFTKSNNRYDIIYDTVGKSSFPASKPILTENGQYISPVMKLSLLFHMLFSSFSGNKKAKFAASGLKSDPELRSLLTEVIKIYKEGRLKTIIDRQFPLDKIRQAHAFIAGGHKKGNVIINVRF